MALSLFTNSDGFFDDLFFNAGFPALERRLMDTSGKLAQWKPRCDVRENDTSYTVTAEVPGAKKEDVNLELNGNTLTVSGKVEDEKKQEGEKHYRYERSFGTFTRSFSLPKDADLEGIKASHENGILHVEIPKKPKEEPKKIPLN